MVRFAVFSLVLSVVVISCMGQMFQYSRGWTNGKRSPLPIQGYPTVVYEVPESERMLEQCVMQLQRYMHNPYLMRPPYASSENSGATNDQSNGLAANTVPESGVFLAKHNN